MNARLGDDSGTTLVELILYLVIGALFLGLMVGLFVNGLTSQAQTTDRDSATGRAAIVTNSLQTSIRNASAISPATGTSNTLVALVASGTSGWQCRAWVLTTDGKLMYKAADAQFSTTSTAGWTTLATGLAGSLSGATMFSVTSGTQLGYSFTLSVGGSTVPITGGATAQATIGGGGPCW